MKTIWWYQADPAEGWQEIELPEGARLLHYVGGSPGHGRFWAEVDPDAPVVATLVGIWGTGWNVPINAVHVSTDIGPTGYVWHLYRWESP